MPNVMLDWHQHGFAAPPEFSHAGKGGLVVYRAWGAKSSEWGSGYFSLEKPESVLDAEFRFNIADWGNGIHFVSTFRIKEGMGYFQGLVGHARRDLRRRGTQIYLESPFVHAVDKIGTFEVLRHDAFVSPKAGTA
jgi:hypothetical protein